MRGTQVMVVPISEASLGYAQDVRRRLRAAHLQADVDSSDRKMQKKVREAQLEQYNYILVRLAQSVHCVQPSTSYPYALGVPLCCSFMESRRRAQAHAENLYLNAGNPICMPVCYCIHVRGIHSLKAVGFACSVSQAAAVLPAAGGGGGGEEGGPGQRAHARQPCARHALAGARGRRASAGEGLAQHHLVVW